MQEVTSRRRGRLTQVSCFTMVSALLFLAMPGQGANYLWLDRTVQPGYFHQAWFLAAGNPAANIELDAIVGGVTLNTAITAMAPGDHIYSVAHGFVEKDARGRPLTGGLILLEGAIPEGFAAGTDPGALHVGGAPYAVPDQPGITWRQVTCYANTVPPWGGGAISVLRSANNRLTLGGTATGPVPIQYFYMGWRVGGAGTLVQKQACLNKFGDWIKLNTPHNTVTRWYDATLVANHGANMAALNAGPVAAYNATNGTTIALTANRYIYDPGVAARAGDAPLRDDEVDLDLVEPVYVCMGPDGVAGEEPTDCNDNGTEDVLEIAAGTSDDCNQNGVPDECEDEVECIPTVSEWGLLALTLLVLVAGTLVVRRRVPRICP